MWTHKEADLAPYPFVDCVLQVGNMEKFPQALGFKGLDPLFRIRVSKQGPCFTGVEEDGGDKILVQLNLLANLKVLLCQILFNLAIADVL